MTNITKKNLITAAVAVAMSMMAAGNTFAANVPTGVQLAEKQVLVRNNGSEPQSLDPHKIEGVPESNISRDLLEGLVINDPNAILYREPQRVGIIKTLKSGRLIFVKMPNGQMVTL